MVTFLLPYTRAHALTHSLTHSPTHPLTQPDSPMMKNPAPVSAAAASEPIQVSTLLPSPRSKGKPIVIAEAEVVCSEESGLLTGNGDIYRGGS